MNQEIKSTYFDEYGKRFSKREKHAFQEKLQADFEMLGYPSEVRKVRSGISKIEHIYVGNIKQAKQVIVVPYNTPSRVFLFKNKFYPQDGYLNMKKMFLPTYAPMFLGYILLLLIVYILPTLVNATILSYLYPLAFLYLFFLMYFIFKGFPNKHNAVRNSASIAIALELAQQLSPSKRKELLFVFTDGNKNTKSQGNKSVMDYFVEKHKISLNIINLFCIGKAGEIRIAHDRNSKSVNKDLLKQYKGNTKVTSTLIDENGKYNTTLENLQSSLIISSGVETGGSLCVEGVATSKDRVVDEQLVDDVLTMLEGYINKKK